MSGGGLRKERRSAGYVRVWNDVACDEVLSYRALGLLTFLLSRPEGWDVRSQLLSRPDGREGREAVRTALRELARRGYYRLERRRLRDGRCVMGTAVADHSVDVWARQYATCGEVAVAVVEQPDGSFVTATDPDDQAEQPEQAGEQAPELGTLDAEDEGHIEPEPAPEDDPAATGDGFPGPGKPGPGLPGAGKPDAGFLGPLYKKVSQEGQPPSSPSHDPPVGHEQGGGGGDSRSEPENVEARALAVLDGLGSSWPLTRGQRTRLAKQMAGPLRAGWLVAELVGELGSNPDGVRAPNAVLTARIADLRQPPARPAAVQRPPWCGGCDESTRLAETDAESLVRCPRCHPLRVDAGPTAPTPETTREVGDDA